MIVTLKVELDVEAIEDDVTLSTAAAFVAAMHGVSEALKQGESRGFNHEHSDWVSINVAEVSCESIMSPVECIDCGKIGRMSSATPEGSKWICQDCINLPRRGSHIRQDPEAGGCDVPAADPDGPPGK